MRAVVPRVACRLPRSVLRVEGRDAPKLLQNLVTNDVGRLTQSRAIYAHFLNAQGRLQHDALLINRTRSNVPSFLIDVHARSGPPLLRHLQIYKMRQDVQVTDVTAEHSVWAVLSRAETHAQIAAAASDLLFVDPRSHVLGQRLVTAADAAPDWAAMGIATADHSLYDLWRHLQGIGEGPDELPTAGVLPLEANLLYMDGVSFEKGCYLGQELTARTHHTGVIRKRVMPCLLGQPSVRAAAEAVQSELCATGDAPLIPPSLPPFDLTAAAPALGTDLTLSDGRKVGRLLSHLPNTSAALALVRLEHVAEPITVGSAALRPLVPAWWPRPTQPTQ